MTIDEWITQYRVVEAAKAKRNDQVADIQSAFDIEVERVFRASFPNKKVPRRDRLADVIGKTKFDEIYTHHLECARVAYKVASDEIEGLHDDLVSAATHVAVPKSSSLVKVCEICEYEFSTQTNPAFYSRKKAELRAFGYSKLIETEVVLLDNPQISPPPKDYGVFARTTDDGAILLRHRFPLSFTEEIRWLIKNGANPQVIWHNLLPQNYLTLARLDLMGNDIK